MTEPTLLEKPTPPADSECCDSACNPCVWDHYYAALKAWRIQQAELKEKEKQKEKQELTSK